MTATPMPRPDQPTLLRARALVSAALRADSQREFSTKEATLLALVPDRPQLLETARQSLDPQAEAALAAVVAERLQAVQLVLDPLAGFEDPC